MSAPSTLPKAYLARKLAEPLPTTDGGVLTTIGDAIKYMTALPKHREMGKAWQHAAKLIIAREPVEAITRQLSLALFMDTKLDLGATKHARAKSARQGALTRKLATKRWDVLGRTPN